MTITRRTVAKLFAGAAAGTYLAARGRLAFAQTRPVVVALESIPNALDPLRYLTNPGYRVMYNLYDTLIDVDYRQSGALRPGLATAWKRIDAQTLELTLRQGVKFHDGSTMTVDDVLFTFSPERIGDPNSPGYGNAQQHLSTIAGAEKVDDQTVRITAKSPDPALELRLSAWGSQIIPQAAFAAAGGWDGFAQKPVGTGPFRVGNFSVEEVRLEAFPEYWGGAPNISTVVYRGIPELSSRIAGLASGELDLIADVAPDQFEAVTNAPDQEIIGGTIASIRVVKFDTRNETLTDPRIRQALGLAIDRQAIVDALWHGLVEIPRSHQLVSYGDLYNPDRPQPAFDPEAARQLLSAGGYNGTAIPYRIRTNAYGPELATAQILVSMWNAVGVNIDMQIKENFGQMLEYPGTGMRNGVDPVLVNDPLFALWRSYNEAEKDVWSNEEFYRLGHQLETESDPAARKAAFQAMLDIFDTDPPATILHTMGLFYGKKTSLTWTAYPHVFMDFRAGNASLAA